jgi:putative toxin-antitoxin system antitoxin component (TIGR02293 family)
MLAEKDITDALGGTKLLGKQANTILELADMIQQGLPTQSVFYLQKQMALGDDDYSSTLGVSVKWLGRYRKAPRQHLDANVSDRLFRIARLFKLAEEVLEDKEAANRWLHLPQSGLGERTPLELMKNEAGAREVEELLYRIEYGIYA